jgi:MFS family permease
MRRLLAQRDARLLLAGETLSLFGDRAMFLALGVWVKSLTGSSSLAGLVFFVFALPFLAAPLGGLLVDRVRRRPLMIWTDLAIGSVLLLLLLVHDRSQIWLIYVVAACYGASGVVFGSARSALLTVMLEDELLPDANAALQTISEGMRLIAPLVGAGLFAAIGGGAVAALDAATFGMSAFCLALLSVQEPTPAPHEHHWRVELMAGIKHVARTPVLSRIVSTTAVAVLVVGFAETLIFSVIDLGLHRPPSFLGVLIACQGVGAIAGGLTAAPLLRRIGDARLVGLGILVFGVGELGLLGTSLSVVVPGIVVAGAGLPWAVVGFMTAVQRRTPPQLQGRAAAAADMLLSVPQTISLALGAVLATVVDYRILVVVMAVVIGACGVTLLPGGRSASVGDEPQPA